VKGIEGLGAAGDHRYAQSAALSRPHRSRAKEDPINLVFEHSCLRQPISRTIPKITSCILYKFHAVRAKPRSDQDSNDLDSSTLTWEYNLGSIRIYTEGMREEQGAVDEEEGAGGLELVEGEEDEDEGEDEGVDAGGAAEHGGRGRR
jgi:hypothetical protein